MRNSNIHNNGGSEGKTGDSGREAMFKERKAVIFQSPLHI